MSGALRAIPLDLSLSFEEANSHRIQPDGLESCAKIQKFSLAAGGYKWTLTATATLTYTYKQNYEHHHKGASNQLTEQTGGPIFNPVGCNLILPCLLGREEQVAFRSWACLCSRTHLDNEVPSPGFRLYILPQFKAMTWPSPLRPTKTISWDTQDRISYVIKDVKIFNRAIHDRLVKEKCQVFILFLQFLYEPPWFWTWIYPMGLSQRCRFPRCNMARLQVCRFRRNSCLPPLVKFHSRLVLDVAKSIHSPSNSSLPSNAKYMGY